MSTKLQAMKERLTEAAGGGWVETEEAEEKIEGHIPREQADAVKAQKRREQQHLAFLREQQEKDRLQRQQYELTNQQLIDSLLGDAATVAYLEDEIATGQTALDALSAQYGGVCQRVREISKSDEVDLSSADPATLIETAIQRRRAAGDEAAALRAVKLELERRIGVSEAGLGEKRAELHRVKRVVLHQYCDAKIAELRPLIEKASAFFVELERAEDMIRGLGGIRQYFYTRNIRERLKHTAERWDVEVAEVRQLSEHY